jgi:hypothetical protein
MVIFTEEWLIEHNERMRRMALKNVQIREADLKAHIEAYPPDECDPGPESELQERIEKWCKENGFPFFHDRSRNKNEPGFPDLVIALRDGRTLWIELKSKDGRLKKDQEKWRLQLMALGHEHHVIRSFKRFMEVVNAN